jgi:hypothetical protein
MKYRQTRRYPPNPNAEYTSVPSSQLLATPSQVRPLSRTWMPAAKTALLAAAPTARPG